MQLYDRVCSFENLWLASRNARKGKRLKPQVVDFEFNLEANLFRLQEELKNERYAFGGYRQFTIHEPKERIISAAPYSDRVVHHALCNVIEPILDRAMIYDSYACRVNKGSHRAIERAHHFLRGSAWVLKLDMKKYFFSVDHEILKRDLSRKIGDAKVMKLVSEILRTYNSPSEYYQMFDDDTLFDIVRPRGLPIGNLTSQLFANYYLSGLDRFIKEKLKCGKYLRYMDDCLVFSGAKSELTHAKIEIDGYLAVRRLVLHPQKTQIFPQKNGVSFLGFHLYPHSKRILRSNLQRFKQRMKKQSIRMRNGDADMHNVLCSLNAWLGYADKRRNKQLINELLEHIRFTKQNQIKCFTFCVE